MSAERRVEREDEIVHEYDGILEADNRLPRWWLYTLYGAIVFAGAYWLYYEAYGTGATPAEAYQAEKIERARVEAARLAAEGPMTPEKLVAMSRNAAILASGREVFTATCASCHLVSGGGQVGPNLTDGHWIHGSQPEKILATIRDGFLDKGMPAWGPQLGQEKVRDVTAYVLSIKGTNVPGGKEPQGTLEN